MDCAFTIHPSLYAVTFHTIHLHETAHSVRQHIVHITPVGYNPLSI